MNIGEYDAAWAAYDHANGPALIAEAQNPFKVGDTRPNWRLKIEGLERTSRLISWEVTFSASGESMMTFTVADQLYQRALERARVYFWLGYGTKLVPLFWGRLAQPKDHRSGLYSEATAYGPSTQAGTRYFRARVSYANSDAREAWLDVMTRAGGDENVFEWNCPTTTLEGEMESFGFEHSFLEASQAMLEPQGLVAVDQPSPTGKIVAKQPLRMDLANRGNLAGIFPESAYPKDPGFTFAESTRNMYNNVIVARRSEDYAGGSEAGVGAGMVQNAEGKWVPAEFFGSDAEILARQSANDNSDPSSEYAVYAERPVPERGAPPEFLRRAYIIPDYPGSQQSAANLAEHLAGSLGAGRGVFTYEGPPVDFALYDVFGVESTVELRPVDASGVFSVARGNLFNRLYACQVEELTYTGDATTFNMAVSGAASEREAVGLGPAGSVNLGQSAGIA